MPSAAELRHIQRKIYFNFVVQESLRTFLNHIFTRKVVKINCICHTTFGLVNPFYQYFRFYNSSVLYYNKVATLFLKSTGGCFLDS